MHTFFRYFGLLGWLIAVMGCGREPARAAEVTTPASQRDTAASAADTEDEATPVRVMQVEPIQWNAPIEASGKALAKQESTLSLGVSGMVKDITVARGDRVRKGDVLLKLERTGYLLGVQQAEAALAGARAQQELMKTETVRLNRLLAEGAAPSASKDELIAKKGAVDAQVSASEASLGQAKKALKDSVLRAPYDGVIGDILIEKGEQAHAMPPTMLMKIADFDTLEVQVFVPEEASSHVGVGDGATVAVDSVGVVTEGKVIFVSDTIDSDARAFEVRVAVDNLNHRIKAGSFTRVQLKQELQTSAIFVPVGSVQRDRDNQPFVFVAAEGTAHRKAVRLGGVEGATVQILEGLTAGELVAVGGVASLAEGQRISIVKE